ncbi:hypothetical protein KIL84_009679 [Mauremys mutica]|uniref:Uncharacterized protein n=1 Tax=Mauremys mutica TaxID=74926 RepID=A0A9D3XMT5_9SAUR|nr:hypothetical protein KIL84_009679 [Mauremys mutica]
MCCTLYPWRLHYHTLTAICAFYTPCAHSPWLIVLYGNSELHITVQTSHCNDTISTDYTRCITPLCIFHTYYPTLVLNTDCTLIVEYYIEIVPLPYVHCSFQATMVLLYHGLAQIMISGQWHKSRVMPQSAESLWISVNVSESKR